MQLISSTLQSHSTNPTNKFHRVWSNESKQVLRFHTALHAHGRAYARHAERIYVDLYHFLINGVDDHADFGPQGIRLQLLR